MAQSIVDWFAVDWRREIVDKRITMLWLIAPLFNQLVQEMPDLFAGVMQLMIGGDALSPASRQQLQAWLIANTTGGKRLRAGLPPDWQVGEKTGTATRVGANDAGFARPPHGTPVLISAYLQTTRIAPAQRDEILATVGRLAAELVQG